MSRLHILKGFSDIDGALWVLKNHSELKNRLEMVTVILKNGINVTDKSRFEILQLLREWHLVEQKHNRFTSSGNEFYSLWQMKKNTAIDVLHGLQYGLWNQLVPDENLASWAYQQVCNFLWEYQMLPQSQDLVAYIYDSREELNKGQDNITDAFSTKSVNSALDWISELSPSVFKDIKKTSNGKNFKNTTFTRRTYCSTALFLMGLSWIVRKSGNNFGELVVFDEVRKRHVCKFCLIEENSFDFMLKDTLRRFSFISIQHTVALYINIEREPRIKDF